MKDIMPTWGDSSFGHQHTRLRCAQALRHYADENFASRGKDIPGAEGLMQLIQALEGPDMPDDCWDEIEACAWLNEHAPFVGAYWGWLDGDFGLWLEEGET